MAGPALARAAPSRSNSSCSAIPERRLWPRQRCVSSGGAKALKDKGICRSRWSMAGWSGYTTSEVRERLDWSLAEGTQAVILELGAMTRCGYRFPSSPAPALANPSRASKRATSRCLFAACWRRQFRGRNALLSQRISLNLANDVSRYRLSFFPLGRACDAGLHRATWIPPTPKGSMSSSRLIMPIV